MCRKVAKEVAQKGKSTKARISTNSLHRYLGVYKFEFGKTEEKDQIGLATGFPLVIVALIMGIILGGLVAVILLGFKIKKRKEAMPFGPFLAVAAIVTLLWGSNILSWYLGIF